MDATSLAHIHDDILAAILDSLFLDVVRLWLIGNRALNQRIARCCRTFRFSPWWEHRKLKRWPRMVSNLTSLQTLSISALQFQEDLSNIAGQVCMLSSTLLHLNLHFKGAAELLFEPTESSLQSPLSPTSYLESSTIPTLEPLHTSWSIKERFPLLKSLTLRHKGSFRFSSTVSPFFHALPAGLETLNWSGIVEDEEELSLLPQGLTSLVLSKQSPLELFDPLVLPPRLTHLSGVYVSSLQALKQLPRSLLGGSWLKHTLGDFKDLDSNFLAALPPSLNMLCGPLIFPTLDPEHPWPSLLPKLLTKLEMRYPPLDASILALLPRTIIRLINVSLDYDVLFEKSEKEGLYELHDLWPPHLTSIILSAACSEIEPHMSSLFPPTLLELQGLVVRLGSSLLRHASKLPPLLTRLHARGGTLGEIEDPLPVYLTDLELKGSWFSSESFKMLPRGLKRLVIPSWSFGNANVDDALQSLPKRLEVLHIRALTAKHLHLLPSRLHTLYALLIHIRDDDLPIRLPPALDRVIVDSSRPHNFRNNSRLFSFASPDKARNPQFLR